MSDNTLEGASEARKLPRPQADLLKQALTVKPFPQAMPQAGRPRLRPLLRKAFPKHSPKAKLPGQSPRRPPFPHLSRLKRHLRRLQQLFLRHLTPRLLHLPLRLSLLRNAPYLRLLPLRLTPIMTRTFSLPTFSSVTQFQRVIPCTDF